MTEFKQLPLCWKKSKVSDYLKEKMDTALVRLSELTGQQFHRITHLFGKMFTCKIDGLLFFSAGNGIRPSTIVIVAIYLDGSEQVFFPGLLSEDMDTCCRILGIENEENRSQFNAFVTPQRKSAG